MSEIYYVPYAATLEIFDKFIREAGDYPTLLERLTSGGLIEDIQAELDIELGSDLFTMELNTAAAIVANVQHRNFALLKTARSLTEAYEEMSELRPFIERLAENPIFYQYDPETEKRGCANCGEEFESNSPSQRYCTPKCRKQAGNKRHTEKYKYGR